jgi:hypothetical protein
MKASFTQDYPAPPERLWQVFGQADYLHRKYAAQGISAYRLNRFDTSPERIGVELERILAVPMHKIPSFAQRFVHPEQTLVYVSNWRRNAEGPADFDLEIHAPGLPLQISGRGALREAGAGSSRLAFDFDVRVPVPLLGGRIEKAVAGFIEKSFREEHAFTLQYLAEAG